MVAVSLSTSTDYSGEQNALIEELGTALTVNFELDEAAPEGGLKVFVDSDIEQIVSRLDLPSFAFNPTLRLLFLISTNQIILYPIHLMVWYRLTFLWLHQKTYWKKIQPMWEL